MKLFLDSACIKDITELQAQGLIDGLTTNPSLIAKSQSPRDELILKICNILKDKPVSAEVLSTEAEAMYQEACNLAKIHPNVVIKVPLISSGLQVIKRLSQKGIKTNCTLCFSPNQALLAAKAGASFISVFVGRLDDIGSDGCQITLDCHKLLQNYNFPSQILAASIRHPKHVLNLAAGGVPICTLPYKIFHQLIQHPLTDSGLKKFLEDAAKA